MPDPKIRATTAAVAFGVYADLAYNLYSATNSSPQTTELFAGERTETLWKYVVIGHLQAVALGIFGSILDRTLWPIFGTLSIGGVMHCMYKHALKAGGSQAPPLKNAMAGAGGTAPGATAPAAKQTMTGHGAAPADPTNTHPTPMGRRR